VKAGKMAGKLLILKFIIMKKKIIIASASVLFAVASVLNINMLQANSVGDVSLENIAMMAQANGGESWFMMCVYASGTCTFPDGFSVPGVRHY